MSRTNPTLRRAALIARSARTAGAGRVATAVRRSLAGPVTARLASRPPRQGRDRGSITLWVAVTFAAILAVAALVADGGARIRAGERADIVAGEAARAASYAAGPDAVTRTAAAAAAARTILSQSGVTGTVAVIGPGRVDIAVQASADGPISGYTYTVTRNATAQLLLGVGTGGPP